MSIPQQLAWPAALRVEGQEASANTTLQAEGQASKEDVNLCSRTAHSCAKQMRGRNTKRKDLKKVSKNVYEGQL